MLLERQTTNEKNSYGTAVGRNKIALRLSTIKVDVRATFFFFKHSTADSQQQGFML